MSPRLLAPALALALLAGCSGSSSAPASPTPSPTASPTLAAGPKLDLRELATFSSPVWVGPAPGDPTHLFLVEKTGRILQLDADGRQQAVLMDLSRQISKANEQGLLSMAFDPGYATNHRLYVNYTDKAGDTRVEAYTVRDGVAGSPQLLYGVDQPFSNHNGGLLLFDPTGMLLVGLGDGGSAADPKNRAQNLADDLGKILRLDPRTGAAAPGNPYPENPKVWALGLRNPWRFSFDTNGDFYLGDVGQNRVEEINVVPPDLQRGGNYGWAVYEGSDRFKPDQQFTPGGPLIMPALTYLHSEGGCSVTGGQVYRGRALRSLVGSYVFGDYCAGELWAADRTPTGLTPLRELGLEVDGLQAFGLDLRGELLVMSAEKLYRLTSG